MFHPFLSLSFVYFLAEKFRGVFKNFKVHYHYVIMPLCYYVLQIPKLIVFTMQFSYSTIFFLGRLQPY
jgi:hypothetical protein